MPEVSTGTARLVIGVISKDSPLIGEGEVVARLVNSQLVYSVPRFPFPDTQYRRERHDNVDMFFLAIAEAPEFKWLEVVPTPEPCLRDVLEAIDPATELPLFETIGMTMPSQLQNVSGDNRAILQVMPLNHSIAFEVTSVRESSDPHITDVFDALEIIRSPIQEATLSGQAGVLEKYNGMSISDTIIYLLENRDSALYDFYLDGTNYQIEANTQTTINTALSYSGGGRGGR